MPRVLLILLFLPIWTNAQHCCCCKLRSSGQAEYKAKRYELAIEKWERAKTCSDATKCPDLDKLILQAKALTKQPKSKASSTVTKSPSSGPDNFIYIRGGAFKMGDVMGDNEFDNEKGVHTEKLGSYYLSPFEVTFEEFDRFCQSTGRKKTNDEGWGRGKRPVIHVNWYDAIEYCNWLSNQRGLTPVYTIDKLNQDPENNNSRDDLKWLVKIKKAANGYRLPTEAEWEYAARQHGQEIRFGNGKQIASPKEINFNASIPYKKEYSVAGGYIGETTPVGRFAPNALKLYDMSGNVWEWCWDWYKDYPMESPTNKSTEPDESKRVLRGGSWYNSSRGIRNAFRGAESPAYRNNLNGFRLARSPQ